MTAATSTHSRRLFVPEVIQTSGMDCGPASLKALLEGFGIAVNYSRLREACQTDIDGSSIDVLEDVAAQLGLSVGQFIVPRDHLLMPEADALPGIVVTILPNGLAHFVVVWRTHRQFVQVMDPAAGRVLKTHRRFLRDVYPHRFPVSTEVAHEWFNAPAFIAPLRRRMTDLGFSPSDVDALLEPAQATTEWFPLAAIDAATRLVARLSSTEAMKLDASATTVLKRLAAEAARRGPAKAAMVIPPQYWSARALPNGDVELYGAVILHAEGKAAPNEQKDQEEKSERQVRASPELAAAMGGETSRPIRSIIDAALAEHQTKLCALPAALLLAGAATGLEGLVLSGLASVRNTGGAHLDPARVIWVVTSFLLIALLLNLSLSAVLLHIGRWLDIHLRVRLLDKLPRLGNYYFHSRLKSDLAQRAHELRSLRQMPQLVGNALRVTSEILFTALGLVWLVPSSAVPVVFAVLVILGLPIALFPWLREQDLRRETHTGVLIRFHLDALLGLTPIKAHRAEEAVRTEHESLLVKWAAATREFYWTHIGGLAAGMLAGTLFAIWALNDFVDQGRRSGLTLIVLYWALKLPMLSQEIVNVLRQLPAQQNRLGRLFDVLNGPEETEAHAHRGENRFDRSDIPHRHRAPEAGVHVRMRSVSVHAGGQLILSDVNLEIRPGEHLAIVGPSGSGKTSFAGLLLGWHRASTGSVLIDGELAEAERTQRLRRETAWIDPAVQIWNRSFDENLSYGNGDVSPSSLRTAVKSADLADVLARLPDGGKTSLGEGGGLVSGGEGQRVRLARAMLRPGVRLVILDEPFRGLDHDQRCALLSEARRRWSQATLIYISHDIDTALDFDRVLVFENGQVAEDDAPNTLLERSDSRLAALKEAHDAAHREIWQNPVWRRWWMERGKLREPSKEGHDAA